METCTVRICFTVIDLTLIASKFASSEDPSANVSLGHSFLYLLRFTEFTSFQTRATEKTVSLIQM